MRKLAALLAVAAALISAAVAINPSARKNEEKTVEDPALSASLAQAREQRIADLHGYASEGVFPHNHGHPGERVPYFMDRHGRLCAVGFLIAKSKAGAEWDYARFMAKKNVAMTHSGMTIRMRGDEERIQKAREVDERFMKLLGFFNDIATANNNIRIKDIHDGPVLDWILNSGLTQEEAALIQPGYSHLACDDCLAGSETKRKTFGRQTEDSKAVEEMDRYRLQDHFREVEKKLRADSAASLKTCATRLKARG